MSDISMTDEQIKEYHIKLGGYVPKWISQDPITSKILNIQGDEIGKVNYYIDDLVNQCFIDTATWGLEAWEEICGIETITTDTYEMRRGRIKSTLRGRGATTVQTIKDLCESFANGEVEVIEHNDEYYFEIKFISTIGVPDKIQDLYDAIEKFKPAHLGVKYTFSYEPWSEVANFTWEDVANFTWDYVLTKPLYSNNKTLYSKLTDGTYSEIEFK